MLTMLAGNAFCPCCAFGFSRYARRAPAVRRASGLSCTTPLATPVGRWSEATGGSSWSRTLCLEGGTVVDPRNGSLTENATVFVEAGRIASIQTNGSVAGPDVDRIDARGKYVVLGYNDMHSHVLELDDPSGGLALMLAEGVTGFRQMSGSPQRLAERRNGTLPVGRDAPALLEMPGEVLTPLNARSPDEVAIEIRLQQEQGADFIKVGFVAAPVFVAAMEEARRAGIPILGHLQDGVDAAVAAKAGFRSVEHLGPGTTVWVGCSAAEAELKSEVKPVRLPTLPRALTFLTGIIRWRMQAMLINPVAFASPDYAISLQRALDTFSEDKFEGLAAQFVDEGTWHVPTLVRLRTQELADAPEYQSHAYLQYMPADKIRKWRSVTNKFRKVPSSARRTYADAYPRQLELTKRLDEAGIRMLTGTDGGWLAAPGLTLKEEFAELAKAGLTPKNIRLVTARTILFAGLAAALKNRVATVNLLWSVAPGVWNKNFRALILNLSTPSSESHFFTVKVRQKGQCAPDAAT